MGIRSIAYSPDGKLLAAGAYPRTTKIWETETGRCLLTITDARAQGPRERLADSSHERVTFSPNDQLLAIASQPDGTITLWRTNGERVLTIEAPPNGRPSAAFSPNSRFLAWGAGDNTVRLFDMPDGRIFVLKMKQKAAELWDVSTRQQVVTFEADAVLSHLPNVNPFVFSRDRTLAACGDTNRLVWVWNVADGKALGVLPGHSERIRALRFSRDSKILASGSMDNTVMLWDLTRKQEIATLRGSGGWIRSMDFSTDGRTLATVSSDGAIKLWSLSSFREWMTLPERSGPQSAVTFTAGERALLCLDDEDHRLRVFRAPTLAEIEAEIAGNSKWRP